MADIYLSEFEKLKDEQISRSAHRDRLFHLTLVLFGGGITIALTNGAHMQGVLLALPVVAFIAGTSHIACDRRISSIGSYIKSTLTKRIAEREQLSHQAVFEWESFIDTDKLRRSRKVTQFFSNFFLYVMSGFGAIAWYWYGRTQGFYWVGLQPVERLAVGVDIILMATMAWQLYQHAYIGRSKERAIRSRPSRAVLIQALVRYGAALVVAGLAGFAMVHFAGQILARPDQAIPLGFAPLWPVTRAAVAGALAFILGGGAVLLGTRR